MKIPKKYVRYVFCFYKRGCRLETTGFPVVKLEDVEKLLQEQRKKLLEKDK